MCKILHSLNVQKAINHALAIFHTAIRLKHYVNLNIIAMYNALALA